VIRISFSFIGVSAFGFSTLWYLSIYIPPQQKPQQTLLLHFAFQYRLLFLFRSKETEPQNIKRVDVTCFALTEASRSATTTSLSLSLSLSLLVGFGWRDRKAREWQFWWVLYDVNEAERNKVNQETRGRVLWL
jgi:hypothetical protein